MSERHSMSERHLQHKGKRHSSERNLDKLDAWISHMEATQALDTMHSVSTNLLGTYNSAVLFPPDLQETLPDNEDELAIINAKYERALIFDQVVKNAKDFDRTASFTYALVLRKTTLWDTDDQPMIVARHKGLLEQLTASGLECVLFPECPLSKQYNKHGIVIVGIRHSSESVLTRFYQRLASAQLRVQESLDDDAAKLLSPADILELTHLKIRSVLADENDKHEKNLGPHYISPPIPVCCWSKRVLALDDMMPYSPVDLDRSLVHSFFPLPMTDHQAKKALFSRFWKALKKSVTNPLNPMVFINFCENVAHLHGNNVAMYFLYMLFTLQVILLPGIAGFALTSIIIIGAAIMGAKDATNLKYGCECAFGAAMLLVWFPMWRRRWERVYKIVQLRWEIDKKKKITSAMDINPNANYTKVYDAKMKRLVRRYSLKLRYLARCIGYPVLLCIGAIIFFIFFWVAVVFAAMYNLPRCSDCRQMMTYRDPTVFFEQKVTAGDHPFADWRNWNDNDKIGYEEFTRGWIGQSYDQGFQKKGFRSLWDSYIPDQDCETRVSPCTEGCESAVQRMVEVVVPRVGNGMACQNATSCRPGEGKCPLGSVGDPNVNQNILCAKSCLQHDLLDCKRFAEAIAAQGCAHTCSLPEKHRLKEKYNCSHVHVFNATRKYEPQVGKCTYLRTNKPEDCFQSWPIYPYSIIAGYFPTCWERLPPDDAAMFYSPLVPGILWTFVLGNTLASMLVTVARKINNMMLIGENWRTNEHREDSSTRRMFFMTWLTLFAFNLIFVFVFIRFGHLIFWEAYYACEQGNYLPGNLIGLHFVGYPPGIWNPANDLIVGEWFGLIFDFLLMNLIVQVVPMLFALCCKKGQIPDIAKVSSSFRGLAKVGSSFRSSKVMQDPSMVMQDPSTKLTASPTSKGHRPQKTPSIKPQISRVHSLVIQKKTQKKGQGQHIEACSTLLRFSRQSIEWCHQRDKCNYEVASGASRGNAHAKKAKKKWGRDSLHYKWHKDMTYRIVDALRPINPKDRLLTDPHNHHRVFHGKGTVTASSIISCMERGSFNDQVDFMDVVFRGAIIAFFSSFLPFITTLSYLFLFLHVVLKVAQLLFYKRRPHTTGRHNAEAITWAMGMTFNLAVTFVVLYWTTVSWSMLGCENPIVQSINVATLSIGTYYCTAYEGERMTDFSVFKLLAAIALIPACIFWHQMVMHCCKDTPTVVMDYVRQKSEHQRHELEARFIKNELPEIVNMQLIRLYSAGLRLQEKEQDLSEMMIQLVAACAAVEESEDLVSESKAEGDTKSEKQLAIEALTQELKDCLEAALSAGLPRTCLVASLAHRMTLNPSLYTEDMINIVTGHQPDFGELATSRVEKLAGIILQSKKKANYQATNIGELVKLARAKKELSENPDEMLQRLKTHIVTVRAQIAKEAATGALSSTMAHRLQQFVSKLGVFALASNDRSQYPEAWYHASTEVDDVLEAIRTNDHGLRVWRTKDVFAEAVMQTKKKRTLKNMWKASLDPMHLAWRPLTDDERRMFVADPDCRSTPLQPKHTLQQRNAIYDASAANGNRPDIFHLAIPGRPNFPVGVVRATDPPSDESDTSEINVSSPRRHLADMKMAWDGLERVTGVIRRERHMCKVQNEHFDEDDSGGVEKVEFLTKMRVLYNDTTKLRHQFKMSPKEFDANVKELYENKRTNEMDLSGDWTSDFNKSFRLITTDS